MPELPDVETFRRYLESTSLHQKIDRVRVSEPDILEEESPSGLGRKLHDRRFTDTRRHGKHLFAAAGERLWLAFHFGMTGRLAYFRGKAAEPEHTRLCLDFSSGYHLAFVCSRKFGRIRTTPDPRNFAEARGLGIDALDPKLDDTRFERILSDRKGTIKSMLMNQGILAGIGNVYADEMLYQAGIHPNRRVDQLNDKDRANLFRTLRRVLQTAIDRQADPKKVPRGWLLPHREKEASCPRCSGRVQKTRVSGRATYFCPACQK